MSRVFDWLNRNSLAIQAVTSVAIVVLTLYLFLENRWLRLQTIEPNVEIGILSVPEDPQRHDSFFIANTGSVPLANIRVNLKKVWLKFNRAKEVIPEVVEGPITPAALPWWKLEKLQPDRTELRDIRSEEDHLYGLIDKEKELELLPMLVFEVSYQRENALNAYHNTRWFSVRRVRRSETGYLVIDDRTLSMFFEGFGFNIKRLLESK